jgi:hypothetical protein
MDFCTHYPQLEAAQQERFRQVATRLLAGQVLTPGRALRPDPDWRFIERYRELIDSYLRIGGWRLEFDPGLQIARAVHETGEMRVRFNKLESLVLCVLRLAYHEEHQRMSQDDTVELTVGALRERLIQHGRSPMQLQRRALADALRRLQRHSLVAFERGFEGDDTEVIQVLPLIERVLPADRIVELAERVRAYVAAARPDEESETEADALSEDAR